MEEALKDALRDVGSEASAQLARQFYEKSHSNAEELQQGGSNLAEYFSEVEKVGETSEGMDIYRFTIDHPTAPLHEFGGHIEPTYTTAKSEGWTRDEFYDALEDCNEQVIRKRYLKNAVREIRANEDIEIDL